MVPLFHIVTKHTLLDTPSVDDDNSNCHGIKIIFTQNKTSSQNITISESSPFPVLDGYIKSLGTIGDVRGKYVVGL